MAPTISKMLTETERTTPGFVSVVDPETGRFANVELRFDCETQETHILIFVRGKMLTPIRTSELAEICRQ